MTESNTTNNHDPAAVVVGSDMQRPAATKLLVLLAVLVIAGVAVGLLHHRTRQSTGQSASAGVRTAAVQITDQGFVPATLTVKAHTKVTWHNTVATLRLIAANPYPKDDSTPGLKSQELGQGASFSFTFTKPGTYAYHDDLHPTLNGTIVVR